MAEAALAAPLNADHFSYVPNALMAGLGSSAEPPIPLPPRLRQLTGVRTVARHLLERCTDAAIALGDLELASSLIGALDAADGDPDLEPSGWCVGGGWCTLPEDSEYDFGDAPAAIYGFDQVRHAWSPDGSALFPGLPPLQKARELGLAE